MTDFSYLIVGGSGFIGRNLLTFLPEAVSLSLRSDDWKSNIKDAKTWVNLIGKAHDHKGDAMEGDYYYANVVLTKEVFGAFLNSSANLLIHISSLAAVEEFESSEPLVESDTCHPVSWYGKSKRDAEEWLLRQKLPHNKKIVILRPPMVHGPGDKGNLGLLYKLISKGVPYPLASFDNRRSFISIDNFLFYIKEIVSQQYRVRSGIYHISDDDSVSTKEIIDTIKNVTGRRVLDIAVPKKLIKIVAKIGDAIPIPLNSTRLKKMTSDLLVSNDKIKQTLGINKLPISAKEGLEKTIKSFMIL